MRRIEKTAQANGFTVEVVVNNPAFYLDPNIPGITTLCDVYNKITGQKTKPILLSGGTYARCMRNAVSFGATFHDAVKPAWAGNGHMKNEAYDFGKALHACEVFIKALDRLQDIAF